VSKGNYARFPLTSLLGRPLFYLALSAFLSTKSAAAAAAAALSKSSSVRGLARDENIFLFFNLLGVLGVTHSKGVAKPRANSVVSLPRSRQPERCGDDGTAAILGNLSADFPKNYASKPLGALGVDVNAGDDKERIDDGGVERKKERKNCTRPRRG
jgi:hypothetical protein